MKLLIFSLLLGLISVAPAAFADDPCPAGREQICHRMRHLRATINALDGQREMNQVNYEYLSLLGADLKSNATEIIKILDIDPWEHVQGLTKSRDLGAALEQAAKAQSPDAIVKANMAQTNCNTCHRNSSPASGVRWDEIFKQNWVLTSAECNKPGRNPYLCKNMNGLLTAYSQFLTADAAGIKDFQVIYGSGKEILRILGDLKKYNVLHMSEEIRQEAESRATEIVQLAANNDPSVFEKAAKLPETCMKCHTQNGVEPRHLQSFNVWN